MSARAEFHAKLAALDLSEHRLRVLHQITLEPRSLKTEHVLSGSERIGYVSPVRGGWSAFTRDRVADKFRRHPHGPFPIKAMAAGAIGVERHKILIPKRTAVLATPGQFDGDELAPGGPVGRA